MESIIRLCICGCALLFLYQPFVTARDPDDRRARARETLNARLETMDSAQRAKVVDIKSPSLAVAFKNVEFFGLRFFRYPVAATPTAPLKPNNVFAVVGRDVSHITDQQQLRTFFRKMLTGDMTDPLRIAATASWMALTQELNEDGFFEFEKTDVKLQNSSCSAELRVVEKQGDRGKLTVSMTFDSNGLADMEVSGKIVHGIRPRCQATRLLDADPVVREIMRQDILVMGKRCKPYLDEVSEGAGPELKRVIDDIWQQILDEQR